MASTSNNDITSSSKQKRKRKRWENVKRQKFESVVFSWSLSDILNKDLFKSQVQEVPLTFSCTTHHMNSFTYLLLEETRAELHSQVTRICHAPVSGISELQNRDVDQRLYRMTLTRMSYSPKVGDLIALTPFKPKCINDLNQRNNPFLVAYVKKAYVNKFLNTNSTEVEFMSSKLIDSPALGSGGFAVYLTNLTTNKRIWKALLKLSDAMTVIQRTFSFSLPDIRNCGQCFGEREKAVIHSDLRQTFDSFKLNTSQEAAVLSCLSANKCMHQNSIKLIWGPPGTGKTKTVASLLFILLRTQHRTLMCAPTNIAVVGAATRLMRLVRDHDLGCGAYGLGDIVVYGSKERMMITDNHKELHDIFLDYRLDILFKFLPQWKFFVNGVIRALDNLTKRHDTINNKCKFDYLHEKLISCIRVLSTHLPTSVLSLDDANKMCHSITLLQKVIASFKQMTSKNEIKSEALLSITECLKVLKDLKAMSFIPRTFRRLNKVPPEGLARKRDELRSFCLGNACLIFCTASSSIKLRKNNRPIEMVLIDEAAQLKECESLIPLELPGVRSAVLVGDERQLPSMVQSKVCEEAKFGRSLFERLVLLGHEKHLLNIQYRMHPTISLFPNFEFYEGKILDAPSVVETAREKCFLEGGMYGSYSFINVDSAKEDLDQNKSTKNMLEVAVITEIIANLYRESVDKKQKVTVGCISPYKAQVNALEEKLCMYIDESNRSPFSLKIRSIDGFQGGEEDVIIFSTVRCNFDGSIGFCANCERANVGLTRARHCLWIVGNKETMIKSCSVWTKLVFDADNRGCLYDASDDKNLANAMVHTMVELGYFGLLLKSDSILFKEAKWKVNFTDKLFERLTSISNIDVRKQVVNLLVKLSSGWRELGDNSSSKYFAKQGICNILEAYSVNEQLYLIWSVDLAYENELCTQVLMFWDILPLPQIQQRALCLARVFWNYTSDTINRCLTKRFERNGFLPVTWPMDSEHAVSDQLGALEPSSLTDKEASMF